MTGKHLPQRWRFQTMILIPTHWIRCYLWRNDYTWHHAQSPCHRQACARRRQQRFFPEKSIAGILRRELQVASSFGSALSWVACFWWHPCAVGMVVLDLEVEQIKSVLKVRLRINCPCRSGGSSACIVLAYEWLQQDWGLVICFGETLVIQIGRVHQRYTCAAFFQCRFSF